MQSSQSSIGRRARRQPGAVIVARLKSFNHALRGLGFLLRHEPNARIHFAATLAAIALGLLLHIGPGDWRWLVLAIGLVWSAEAFNTAVEQICDLVHPGPSDRVRAAKDVAAGAVLACAAAAAAIGALTLLPYLVVALAMPEAAAWIGGVS